MVAPMLISEMEGASPETETSEGVLLLDKYIQQILPPDHMYWKTNGVALENMTSREAIERDHVVSSLATKVRGFLAANYHNRGYDSMLEMHASGWDQGAWSVRDTDVPLSLISATITNGHVDSMHLRIEGSTTDFYVSGKALEDFGKTLVVEETPEASV